NGMPLSALVGPRDLMRSADSVGVDMGCRGETLSLASARAALQIYKHEPIAERVIEIGQAVARGIESAAKRERIPLRVIGHPARMELRFDDLRGLPKATALGLFVQGCLERGIITNGLIFPSAAHDAASIDATIEAARAALGIVRRAADGHTAALPPPFGPATIGFLDSAEIDAGQLRLAGWILPLGAAPDSVELVDGDGRGAEAQVVSRPDVAQAYPAIAHANRCGWSVTIPVPSPMPGLTWTL